MKRLKYGLLFLLGLYLIWWIWSLTDRVNDQPIHAKPDPTRISIEQVGNPDSADGNIIGMQPYLVAADYANEASFYGVLQTYMDLAKNKGLLNNTTVVVFPEYIGSWLVAAGEKKKVYDPGSTTADALTLEVSSNLNQFIPAYFRSHSADPTKEALFRMKQPEMVAIYQSVFSKLAATYKVTIVAGSTVLVEPSINDSGKIVTGNGKLYNTAAIFDPAGKPMRPLVKKIFPIADEKGFTCAAEDEQVPVFNTGAGRLAVLVCADSWFPGAYAHLNNKADIIAIPSLGGADSIWNAPWNGYNGFAAPADVDTAGDYHRLTEGGAWVKYAMAKRAPAAGIHNGMNVFFTGALWDMKPEGRVLTLQNDSLKISSPSIKNGRITNLWFRKQKNNK